MLAYLRDEAQFRFDAEAVFVGFGIHAPAYEWDDFKDADVRGKLVFVRVNDPGLFDPARFNGRRMTYSAAGATRLRRRPGAAPPASC